MSIGSAALLTVSIAAIISSSIGFLTADYVVTDTPQGPAPLSVFGGPVRVEDTPANETEQFFPDVAIAPAGRIHVTWLDYRNPSGTVYHARSLDGGQTFRDHRPVATGAGPARVDVGRDGTVHLVWIATVTDFRTGIYYANSTDGGLAFGSYKRLDTLLRNGSHQHYSDPIATSETSVYVAWLDDPGFGPDSCRVYVVRSTDGGNTFTREIRVDDAGAQGVACGGPDPSIAVDAAGTVYVVWAARWPAGSEPSGYPRISVSSDGGVTWGPSSRVDPPAAGFVGFGSFAIKATDFGVAYAALDAEPIVDRYHLYSTFTSDAGATFAAPIQVDEPGAVEQGPLHVDTVVDASGTVWVVWQSESGFVGSWDIRFSRSFDGGLSFTPAAVLVAWPPPNAEISPRIAAGGTANVTVAWDYRNYGAPNGSTDDVYASTYVGSLPDLSISPSGLTVFPAPPASPGVPIVVNATVRNVGSADAADVTVRLALGSPTGQGLGDRGIPALSGRGGQDAVSFPWTPPAAGSYLLCAVADPDGAIPEGDETNNAACVPLEVASPPDLAIRPGEVTVSPSTVSLGDTVFVAALVRNLGGAPARNATVTFFRDGDSNGFPDPGEAFDTQIVPYLTAAGSLSLDSVWRADAPGIHAVCAYADPENAISEGDETNNQACASVEVLGLPDYAPANAMPPGTLTVGLNRAVALSIEVRNLGGSTPNATAILAFYNESTPSAPLSTSSLPPIPPGGVAGPFDAVWYSPGVPGTCRVVVDVDAGDDVREVSETNNAYMWPIAVVAGPVTSLVVGAPNVTAQVAYVTSATPLVLSVLDQSGKGVRRTVYRVDGGPWAGYGGSFTLPLEGEHRLEWFSEDVAGNVEDVRSAVLRVDDTPPTASLMIGDPKSLVGGIFVTSATPLPLTATDGGVTPVGLASVGYRVDVGPWTTYAAPVTLTGDDGPRTVEYRSSDRLGNVEAPRTRVVVLDNTPPTTTLSPEAGPYRLDTAFSLAASDAGSGVADTEYRVDGGLWAPYAGPFTLLSGRHAIEYRSVDRLANLERVNRRDVDIPGPPPERAPNHKPLVALAFVILLTAIGAWSARRAPWRGAVGRKSVLKSFAIASLPFVLAEAATGVVSLLTGLLSIPPILGAGTIVDLSILTVGLVVTFLRGRKHRSSRASGR